MRYHLNVTQSTHLSHCDCLTIQNSAMHQSVLKYIKMYNVERLNSTLVYAYDKALYYYEMKFLR